MIFTEQARYEFYPDIGDNLKKPEAEQAAVEIIRPTGFQTKEFITTVAKREYYENDQPFDDEGNVRTPAKFKSMTVETKIDADRILRTCVGKIRNVQVATEDGAKPRDITSGKELAECRAYGIGELVSAICNEVISDKMTDSKKKNLG